MKSTFKATTITLISLFASVVTTTSSALADDRTTQIDPNPKITVSTPLGCSFQKTTEFKMRVVISNTTSNPIAVGKTLYSQVYYSGKIEGKKEGVKLTQPLATGGKVPGSQQISSENGVNYTCKASY